MNSLINTSFEYTLFFKNSTDFNIDDNIITYMGDDINGFPFKMETIIKYWRGYVNNNKYSNLIKYLYDRVNEVNSLKEVSDEFNIKIQDLTLLIYEFENLNLIRISDGHMYLNPILLYDKEIEEYEEDEDFEDEDFDINDF